MMTQHNMKTARRTGSKYNVNLSKRRNWYVDPPAGDPPAPPTPPVVPPPLEAKFTQADMDSVAGNRAKEAAAKARATLLKELGIENADDPDAVKTVKGKLTAAQQAEDAKKSAEEKALEKVMALEKERDAFKADKEALELKSRLKDRDDDIKTALSDTKLHCKDPLKVLKLLKIDHETEISGAFNDDGKPDTAKLKALIDLGKKENPELFGTGNPGSPSNNNGRTGGNEPDFGQRSTVRF